MLKPIIVLPDGTELSNGVAGEDAILSHTLTECVNSEEELNVGSVCAAMFEATIWNLGGRLTINAGDELTLYKETLDGTRKKLGVFIAEKPTRPSRNTLKLTCYDRVSKLEQDLTGWLLALDGWPYAIGDFAEMVCEQCDLTMLVDTIPAELTFPILKYTKANTTGRMLMQWIAQICGRFCRADADGNIIFDWYRLAPIWFGPNDRGDGRFYYEGKLDYSDYFIEKIDIVQVQLGDSSEGYLYPEKEAGQNAYVIAGNPFLNAVASSGTATDTPGDDTTGTLLGYSYNGVGPLPASPAWDKVNYPHAYVYLDSTGYYSFVCTPTPLVWDGYKWICKTATQRYFHTTDQKEWDYLSNLNAYYAILPTGTDPIWTNTDLSKDGAVYLAASDPVPMYDDGEEDEEPEEDYSNASALKPVLEFLRTQLNSYIDAEGNQVTNVYIAPRPCKVVVPAQLETGAGYLIPILARDMKTLFYCRCMNRVQKNQQDTLEGTGSARRDTVAAQSGSSSVPQTTKLTHGELLEILTNGGEVEGFIFDQGQIYFDGNYVTGVIESADGKAAFDLENREFTMETDSGKTVKLSKAGITLGGLTITFGDRYEITADEPLALTAPTLILNGNTAAWTDNGDGTYTMTGTPVTE